MIPKSSIFDIRQDTATEQVKGTAIGLRDLFGLFLFLASCNLIPVSRFPLPASL